MNIYTTKPDRSLSISWVFKPVFILGYIWENMHFLSYSGPKMFAREETYSSSKNIF